MKEIDIKDVKLGFKFLAKDCDETGKWFVNEIIKISDDKFWAKETDPNSAWQGLEYDFPKEEISDTEQFRTLS